MLVPYGVYTRTLTFCKFCTPVAQYPGYGYALANTPECRHGYGYKFRIPTRTFCGFCEIPMPAPGTSVNEKVVFCRVCTEPHAGYNPYPGLL